MNIARSHNQREILESLFRGEAVNRPGRHLRGRARMFLNRYERAFDNFLARLESAGFHVVEHLGPRGGKWSATYTLENPPTEQ